MARLHAIALGQKKMNVVATVPLILASAALVAGCATTGGNPSSWEDRFPDPTLIYLETNQFLWADAVQRERLVCGNGTPLICTGGQSRLSFAHCGCLPDD